MPKLPRRGVARGCWQRERVLHVEAIAYNKMDKSKDELSPEELQNMLSLLESLQAQGKDLSTISPDLPQLMQSIQKQKGQPSEDVPTEEVLPSPAFVIKTACMRTGCKVFINIVHSKKVPAPGNWQNGIPEEVQKALESREDSMGSGSEHLRFPLSAGQAKQDLDKKGERCVTVDCILNTDIVNQAAAFRPLKAFLIELAIGWVGHKTQMELDAKYKLPKMKYKGDEVEKQNIRVEKKKLVCEVSEVEEEPSFPLRTKKAPAPLPVPIQPAQVETAKASALNAGSSPLRDIKCSVECKGRPVEKIEIGISLPPESEVTSNFTDGIFVEACGRSALISIPGFNDARLSLPYAVKGGLASLDAASKRLQVELSILPVQSYLDQLRKLKPLAFGDLGLHSDGLLDLD